MSWKTKTTRFVVLSALSAPTALSAGEPRIIVPSTAPPKIVFEQDNATYDVLDRFRNARSSEQIHFQAIETMFPRVADRESVREGYTMVREIVEAKKAAMQAADELEKERARLEIMREELEADVEPDVDTDGMKVDFDEAPKEFDYYAFGDSDIQPEPDPVVSPTKSKTGHHSAHQHHKQSAHQHHNHSKGSHTTQRNKKSSILRRPLSTLRSTIKRAGRSSR